MKPKELDRIVLEASFESDGRKKLRCRTAFELAEEHGVSKAAVGESCNRTGVRIASCQLGCFE